MKQQFLSVLFCALICSTLGHEYLRAHELTPKFRRNSLSFRDNSNNESCSYVCPVPKPSGSEGESSIRLIINKEVSVVAVLNITAQIALAVDIQTNLAVLFNGNTGVTILIDLKAETGIHFAAGSSDKLWLASKISFVEYLLELGSLQNVKEFPNGTEFQIKSVSKKIVVEFGIVISALGSELAERIKLNAKVAVSIVLVISKVLTATLGGALSIIIKKVEGVEFVLTGGIVKLVTLLKGLAALSGKIVGGLEALLVADVEFKLSLLLAAASGLEVIVALFAQVASKVDLSKVIGPLLKTPEAFLEVVVSLEAGIYGGISGATALVYNVMLFISKKISITVFIDVAIQVAASGSAVSSEQFSAVISSFVEVIQIQVSTFKSSESWKGILEFFNNLKAGNLVVGGCNVSAILTVLFQNAGKVTLNLVVGILLKLSAVIGIGAAIANLYLRLIFFIISGQGLVYVLKLIPSISLNIDFSSGESIIVQILSGVQVTKILTYILTLNVVGLITHLPVFGDIYTAVSGALEGCGQKEVQLKAGLKQSGIVSILIGWVRYGLGLGGGSAPSGGIAGGLFIGGGFSLDVEASSSVSGSVSASTVSGDSSSSAATSGSTSEESSSSVATSGSTSEGSSSSAASSSAASSSTDAPSTIRWSQTASGSASGSVSASTKIGWGGALSFKHHGGQHKDRKHQKRAHKSRKNEIH